MDRQLNLFFTNFYRLFKIYFFFLAVFSIFRFWFFIRLGDFNELVKVPEDVFLAFFRGMQYDTVIICYFLLVPVLIYCAGLFVKKDEFFRKAYFFISWYTGITLAIACVILFVDQYYYNYFQTHISAIIFGLADDDSQTVMSSVWSDYPILRIAMVWITILVTFSYFLKQIYSTETISFPGKTYGKIACICLSLMFYGIGLKGSFGVFPNQHYSSGVSDNNFVNFLTINGIYALKNAYQERTKSSNLIENELSNLQAIGYNSPTSAAQDYFGDIGEERLSDSDVFNSLFTSTSNNAFLDNAQPNVIFVFMESMSNYNLSFDSKNINLMGDLREHFKSDLVFRNFVSSGNTTIQSLEYLMVGSPVSLSQSKYSSTRFPSSVAIPFINSGYKTAFFTGGKVNWRAMDKFASNQGFEDIKGMSSIKVELPGAQANKWGVYDEYLLDYTFRKLSEKTNKPKFFFVQTTTNHTPFELPSNYKPFEITLTDSLKDRLLVAEDLALKNLNAFQYANHSLGKFLNKIKNSEFAENTIVVVTGDHNNLMLFDFDEAHQLQQRSVPLYLYIPKKYMPKTSFDTTVFASHKDIFPTIFNLSLSGQKYFSLGNNLLDSSVANKSNREYFGMNIGSSTAFSSNAAVNYSGTAAFYTWKNSRSRVLHKVRHSAMAANLLKRSRANHALSVFYILDQLNKVGPDRKMKPKVAQL